MIATTRIDGARVLLGDGRIGPASVVFNNRIERIIDDTSSAPCETKTDRIERANGALLTPGLIDLHAHGIGTHLFESGPADLLAGLAMLPRFGVTTVLPTLYRVMRPESFPLLEQLAGTLEGAPGARAPGFHLEGPFLAITGAGALTQPADVKFLDELLSACRHKVAAMSISPELPGIIPVIERLRECGIVPFVTHTRASAKQTQEAIDAGARHATHFYDVFPLPDEREPGVRPVGAVEVFLADPRATVDFICDGVHVDPVAIRAALAAKGVGGVVAITDSNIGAGALGGEYPTPWGFRVRVAANDAARIVDADHPHHGQLAGSSLTLNKAVANLHEWLKIEPEAIWAMASANPARVLECDDLGAIKPGARADLVLWGDDFSPLRTWVNGELVFDRASTSTG